MAITTIRTPVAVEAGASFDVVLLEDPAVWRENGGRQHDAVEAALEALAAAEQAGTEGEALEAYRATVAEAEAALAEAMSRAMLYLRTSDLDVLEVPDDATVWTLQALDEPQRRQAEDAAGRMSLLGAQLVAEVEERAETATRTATRGKRTSPEERRRVLAREKARAMDRLSKVEVEACTAFGAWRHRHRCELLRRALVSWRNGPDYASTAALVDDLLKTAPSDGLVAELGLHAERIAAGLHPRGKASSASPSGGTATAETSPGAAPSAPEPGCASDEAGAAGRS